tara:strand:- start:124 stop:3405 length:3282 start_codon:yes stop_codon:yes gene_type:complete
MSINQRLFGSPIPLEVKKKLEARQRVAGDVAPGESLDGTKMIDGVFPDKDGNIQADLSSRTPFVRMWTSVKLIDPAAFGDVLEEITVDEYIDYIQKKDFSRGASELPDVIRRFDKFKKEFPKATVIPVKDENGAMLHGDKYKFYIVQDEKKYIPYFSSVTREQTDITRKVYIVGDYNYQSSYGEVAPGESLPDLQTEDSNDTVSAGDTLYEIFPSELEKNPLMKPQTGITKVSSETEGTLGVIKKTTIDFVVHNFYDYDKIFNKYFLRPGATIFVDFGWSSVKSLYNPENLVNDKEGMEVFLYGDTTQGDSKKGEVTKNQGDLEVLQGIVTDYNAKITKNGSVECSVTLTSSNTSLLSFDTDADISKRIKAILERGILFLGIQEIIDDNPKGNDLKQLLNTPDHNSDATDIENYNKNLRTLASKLLSDEVSSLSKGRPIYNAVRTGVFINDFTMEDNYISFGLFEDLIINSQFGFGKDIDDIDKGRSTQVRMNSSNSYTTWNKTYDEGQVTMLSVSEDAPSFLYPFHWGLEPETGGSYSYQKNKLPTIVTNNEIQSYKNEKLSTGSDKTLERIPLRELFIHVDIIIEAFEQNDNVRKVIKQILDTLNEKSFNLFKFKLVAGDNKDSEIKIIDENFLNSDEQNNSYDVENFVFNIMNPNSIVKDYNLEFKLPSGNIGNMYAIQGASHGDNIFSVKNGIIDSKALSKQYGDSLSVIYEPDLGSFRLNQLLDTKNDADVYNVYNQVNKLLSSNVYSIDTFTPSEEFISGTDEKQMFSGKAITDSNKSTEEKKITPKDLIKTNIENQEAVGIKVANSIQQYYQYLTGIDIVKKTPRLLPYTLSLTTYGIASIQPGDTFEVDYLPQMYLKNSYLQVMKVTHDVGPDGWYTTFDTQFRLKSYVSKREEIPDQQIRLSPNVLQSLGFGDFTFSLPETKKWYTSADRITINDLLPYLTDFQVMLKDGYDIVLECTTTEKLSEELVDGGAMAHFSDVVALSQQTDRQFYKVINKSDYDNRTNAIKNGFAEKQLSSSNWLMKLVVSVDVQDTYLIYPKDVVLKSNEKYRFYIRGDRIMMWRLKDVVNDEKQQKYFETVGNQLG